MFSPAQKLPFSLLWQQKLQQALTLADNSTTPIEFQPPEAKQFICYEWDNAQWVKLLSALTLGAEIMYPDEHMQVTQWLLDGVDSPMDLCAIITECLASTFADLNAKLDQIGQGTEGNSARQPENISQTSYDDEYIYSGALAVVRYMDAENRKLYTDAEEKGVDNLQEWIAEVIEAIPVLQELPFDELFELADAHYQNQVSQYVLDYPDFEIPAAFNLYCRIRANNKTFSYEVWGQWLENLFAYTPYPNAATNLYIKYSPLRQTFANQIAAFFNRNASLESYFQKIYQQYFAGSQSGSSLPAGYSCDSAQTLYYDPNPPVSELSLDTDGGQFGYADARNVNAPFEASIDLVTSKTVESVTITMAFGGASNAFVTVEGVDYDLVRGDYIGGATYNYTATVPSISTDTILIVFGEYRVVSMISVTVS